MKKILVSLLATGLLAGSAAAMADEHHDGDWRHGAYSHDGDRGEHRGWDRGNHWGNRDYRGYSYYYETPAYGYTYATPYYYRHHHHHRYYQHYYYRHYGY